MIDAQQPPDPNITQGRTDVPDRCPQCNATLAGVPFTGNKCPHCEHDFVNRVEQFGAAEWDKIAKRHRDTGA